MLTLAVQQELQARLHEVERLRKEQVERTRYEADLAQRRYMRVDPDNRLVACYSTGFLRAPMSAAGCSCRGCQHHHCR